MGEETKQEGAVVSDQAPKPEEKSAMEQKEEKPPEEKKEEAKPSPLTAPPSVVLFVDLHCVGCAKKIQRSILKCRGVEEVETDIEKNEVRVRGIVDPQVLCSRILKKTSRIAKVLSPESQPDDADSSKAEAKAGGMATVELLVNVHCEACAQQLRKKILKMSGVQAVETDLTANKVTVTGTMNANKLVKCIYRRTGKIASVVPPPPQEERNEDSQKEGKPPEKEEKVDEKKTGEGEDVTAEANKEEKAVGVAKAKNEEVEASKIGDAEMVNRMMYWNDTARFVTEEEIARRMAMMHWLTMPMYAIERPQLPSPPQIFSDENPNACCIS
ncbi:hypothetical protein HPP92_021973 [Vanilla planifolia]|uniref:HMA domain-containing protein n=1 Tax=Vanilla planifolia TaxID=51239 RepID=A0A835UF74_VANPL|nr:hypothetical protein HPP92_021973 [Vanilla planifolia]